MADIVPLTSRALLPRLWSWARGLVERPEEFSAGADFAVDIGVRPTLSASEAMQGQVRFPWPFACMQARSSDLAGLHLKVGRRVNGTIEPVEDWHPVEDLLRRPSPSTSGELMRRQWYADYLAGDGYLLVLRGTLGGPSSVVRMLPNRTRPVPNSFGEPGAYDYGDNSKRYPADTVLHLRGLSWQDGTASVHGTSRIRPLYEALKAEDALEKFNATAAAKGRPDVIISPGEQGETWSPSQQKDIRENYTKMTAAGGALVNGMSAKVEPLSHTPRDMEGKERHLLTRDATLAVYDVPGTRVGLPNANYATANQSMRLYWESLRADARLMDAQLTELVRMYPDSADLVVYHDFSEVEALQASKTERVTRATQHILNGSTVEWAYAEEGLSAPDLDPLFAVGPDVGPDTTPGVDGQGRQFKALDEWWSRELPVSESSRKDAWESYEKGLRLPIERRMNRAVLLYLRQQAARLVERLPAAMAEERTGTGPTVTRNLDAIIGVLFDLGAEEAAMRAVITRLVTEAARAGHQRAQQQGLGSLTWEPARAPISRLIDQVTTNVSANTARDIRAIVEQGLTQGASVNEIADAIINASAFSPMRSLRIARTETTRAVSVGTETAYQQAVDAGLNVKRQWLTSRDAHVRATHRELDGQTVDIGQAFRIPSTGEKAMGPGQFASAAESINCRCAMIPIVEDDPA
jgi:phage portal protein BeeE